MGRLITIKTDILKFWGNLRCEIIGGPQNLLNDESLDRQQLHLTLALENSVIF